MYHVLICSVPSSNYVVLTKKLGEIRVVPD